MFTGSLVAIVTPMRPDGSIDPAAWDTLLDWHLASGTAGIVIGGTTGESVTLSDAELALLVARARQRLGGRLPIIAGVGGSNTLTVAQRAQALDASGADALLVVTPAYNRPTQEGLYRHFAAVAVAARLPLVLYNVPSRTAVDLLPETVGRLAKLPRVVAVKEAVASVARIRELVAACGPAFDVLSGDDATARAAVAAGARGVISVTANVAPEAMAGMMAAALRGDATEAERIDATLADLHQALFVEANPIPVKWALAELGRIPGGIRLPLTELSVAQQPLVRRVLRAAQWRKAAAVQA
ncbi:MAG: 4-hydroxy-tetrahydrodipicolinate synthase [Gammaproteobacteria bacterium]|nr:4-hydroxy-tetrahydrodipicolinate synthase [Gammaproteobacteria bacterium]